MSPCERVREDLKAYLDRGLPLPARLLTRLHLNRCEACRKELEEMRVLGARLRAAGAAGLSPALKDRLLGSIPESAAPAGPARRPAGGRRISVVWAGGAAAVLLWCLYSAQSGSLEAISPKRVVDRQAPVATSLAAGAPSSSKVADLNGNALDARATTGGKVDAPAAPATPARARLAEQAVEDRNAPAVDAPRRPAPYGASVAAHAVANKRSVGSGEKYPQRQQVSAGALDTAAEALPTERLVHREASLTIEVQSVEQKTEDVDRIVKEAKGYVAQNDLSTGDDDLQTATLSVKVPVDQFEAVLTQFTHLGDVKARTLSGEDITEKVTDEQETSNILRADIAATRARLRQGESKARTLRDEETDRQLRIRMARSAARLKMLTRLGALANISVELHQKAKQQVVPQSGLVSVMSDTARTAGECFIQAIRMPVELLVWIVVYSPIWGLLLVLYRRSARSI